MAKSTRRTTKVVAMATHAPATPVLNRSTNPSDAEIARRAFELYCGRGRQDGHDVEDWLQAKRELELQQSISSAAARPRISRARATSTATVDSAGASA